MRRNTLNFVIDLLAAAAMLGMIATGLLVRYVLPPGSGGGHGGSGGGGGSALWGLGRHDWGDWHFYLAATAVGLLLLHLALHWGWVWTTTARLAKCPRSLAAAPAAAAAAAQPWMRNSVGVAVLLVVALSMTGLVLAGKRQARPGTAGGRNAEPLRAVEDVARHGGNRGGGGAAGGEVPHLRGRSTLAESARALGLTLDEVRRRAGFPPDAATEQSLGRLCAQQGLTMEEVRARLVTRGPEGAAP